MPRSRLVCSRYPLVALVFLAATTGLVAADPNDWVNVDYVLKQANATNTADARQSIINQAGTSAKSGPWSVVTKNGVAPPSGDVHDYLSWAPYHWPACNWCSKGANHLSGPQQGNGTDDGGDGMDDSYDGGDDPYEDGGGDDDAELKVAVENLSLLRRGLVHGGNHRRDHSRMIRRRRGLISSSSPASAASRRDYLQAPDGYATDNPLPTNTDDVPSLPTDYVPTSTSESQSSTGRGVYGTQAPAQAPAKGDDSGGKCTPSPTKSLAPSATWTTCPYEVRDGRINPDVRTLPDSAAVVAMSQSVLYNALAYVFQKTKVNSQNAAKFVDAFFLAPSTAMNPNMNFGQLVRGPGKAHQMGTFTGILDLRGLVKIVNSLQILKAAGSPDWTSAHEKEMVNWMKSYIAWLENSAIGKETAAKSNNHLSFFVSQIAAAKMYTGDTQGAQTALKNYFSGGYLYQIAASGEQPFEAVRTRPYHYRSFNLEAMITNAKLGDQLGLNFWSAKSKYGATIQMAVDYLIGVDPKDEDISDVFPHVAAVAAAYGDPKGKYAAFLKKNDPNYTKQPFYFYDQPVALPNSPAGRAVKHRREEHVDSVTDNIDAVATTVDNGTRVAENVLDAAVECPPVFLAAKEVELEDELYVTWDELKPYYIQFGYL